MNAARNQDSSASGTPQWPLQLKRGLIVYAVIILGAGWLYEYWQIRGDRELTLEAAGHQLTTIASALGTQVTAMINDGVGAAEAANNEANAQGGLDHLSASQVADILKRELTGGEYVQELFIAAPQTFVSASRGGASQSAELTQQRNIPPPWLQSLFAPKSGETETKVTWVGHAINREQGDAKILIPIAKRVATTHGEQIWVGAVFGIESLDRMYRTLPIERGGVLLVTNDGELLTRIPTVPNVNIAGRNLADIEAFKRYRTLNRDFALFEAPNPVTLKQRQFAVQRISGYPFLAVAGRDIEDSLVAWRARMRNSLQLGIAATVALGALTVALYLSLQRRYDALQRSEERFQLAVAGSNDGIWDWELKSNFVYYSPRFKEHLGFTAKDNFAPVPDTFWNLLHPDDIASIRRAVQRHLSNREPYDVEYRLRTRGGAYRWFRARAQAIWDDSGAPLRMAGSISDIHERKLAEQSLREARDRELHAREDFAQKLILAQEQERRRIANELHDSVGQNLSLIKNRALMALHDNKLSPDTARHLDALSHLTTDVIAEVRAVAQNLRPLHIEQLGLTDALETLLAKVSESSGLKIERRLENVDDVLNGTAATHLFRVVQEAFNNVLKHARAKCCRVVLERDLHCVRLTIADDGIGFDPHADQANHGLGLASIAERARMLSATLQIDSVVKVGTTIHVEIPIADGAVGETPTIESATYG